MQTKMARCWIAVEVRHTTLNSRDHSWGPERHTELTGSRLGSGLNSQNRGWSPARHTELTGSRQEEEQEGGGGGEGVREEKKLTSELTTLICPSNSFNERNISGSSGSP